MPYNAWNRMEEWKYYVWNVPNPSVRYHAVARNVQDAMVDIQWNHAITDSATMYNV